MLHRECPSCGRDTIPVSELLVSDARCKGCGCVIGPRPLIGTLFSILTAATTAVSTFIVLVQFGLYAAIFWFSLPVGAIGYLKARYSPLDVRHADRLP